MQTLEDRKKNMQRKVLVAAFENLFVFAIPAFLALLLVKYLERAYDLSKLEIAGIFVVTFILSWVIVIMRMRKLHKEVKAIETEVNAEKQ